METGYSKWRKLDNAALAFPLVTGKDDTRVFRFYCELREAVDEEILQKALEETIEKYPLFQAVLRKGLFWFYLEHRDIRPVVKKEKKPPCSRLYIPDKKSLLFEVSYHENRINFEVYHALTDGTGAMYFLEELVQNYLILAHPEAKLPRIEPVEEITPGDQEEDSFSQYYSADLPRNKEKKPAAVKLKGEKVVHEEMHILEAELPVKELHAKARARGVSITVYLTAVLLCAIHEEIPKNKQKRPIGLMIPVNLRNYFPSQSMTNFFGWIEISFAFQEDTTFEDVLTDVKEQFKRELTPEKIAMHMNGYVRIEKHFLVRMVPLEIKRYFNIGILKFPEEYRNYIERFGIFASTDSFQLCSCSYEGKMVLGFTSKLPDDSIQRNFLQILKKEEIPCREKKNDFPGCKEQYKKEDKKVFQLFTFLCIAAAVLCGMINYLTAETLNWFWFAGAGCLCTWLIVTVAYRKRRNLLKNEMWQLLLVTAIAVLWDIFTGWRGWSVDFVFPIGALTVLCSVPLIAKVQRLEREEYLFYFIQAAMAGCVPILLVWTGLVKFTYPSVICGGISFLVLAALFIFDLKDTIREFRKKLRM